MSQKVQAQAGLLWRCWDDEFVVYNPASGDSHYLDYLSGEGLKGLERRSMTVSELADELASSCDIPRDSKLQQYVEQMLASFSDLGLTRSARS